MEEDSQDRSECDAPGCVGATEYGGHKSPRGRLARRQLILDATLDLIADGGVRRVSHRHVAELAGVPLGSISYYFSSIHNLLYAAFDDFVNRIIADYYRQFRGVSTLDQAREAVVTILTSSAYMDARNIRIGAELYSVGTQDAQFREILLRWIHRSRQAMALYFDQATTTLLDAFVEGISLHRTLEDEKHSAELIREGVVRLTPPVSFIYTDKISAARNLGSELPNPPRG